MQWEQCAKGVRDPKLRWIEKELDRRGIAHTREEVPFMGPVLRVPEPFSWEVEEILQKRVHGTTIEDLPDDHRFFSRE